MYIKKNLKHVIYSLIKINVSVCTMILISFTHSFLCTKFTNSTIKTFSVFKYRKKMWVYHGKLHEKKKQLTKCSYFLKK